MIVPHIQVTFKMIDQYEALEWTQVPLAMVKETPKWDAYARLLKVIVLMLVHNTSYV